MKNIKTSLRNRKKLLLTKKKDAVESCRHQALKSITKMVKLVKAFLIQKAMRKLSETDTPASSDDDKHKALSKIHALKTFTHTDIARSIFDVEFGMESSVENESEEWESITVEIRKHKKVRDLVRQWLEK